MPEPLDGITIIDQAFENDAYEIARRVLKSYGQDVRKDLVDDLGKRIHRAAADINNERVEAERLGTDIPSSPWSVSGGQPFHDVGSIEVYRVEVYWYEWPNS